MSCKRKNCGVDEEAMVSLVFDAIEFMPEEEKEAFLLANSSGPGVIERESNPLDFLLFEDFDLWKAAKRLMNYWTWRKEIFGERFTNPMLDLSGKGACNDLEVDIIELGALARLPDGENGDALGFLDRSRIGCEDERYLADSLIRGAFCLLEFIRRERRSKGILKPCLGLMNRIPRFGFPTIGTRKKGFYERVNESLPMEIKWVRMLFLPGKIEKTTFLDRFLPYLLPKLANRFRFTKLEILSHESTEAMYEALLASGIQHHCIPQSLGGTWSYDSHYLWFQEQRPCGLQRKKSSDELPSSCDKNPLPQRSSLIKFHLDEEIEKLESTAKMYLLRMRNDLPLIFEKESCQAIFFHHNNKQGSLAAHNLARYWMLREKLFSDRGFLPMNQLGTGAIEKNDKKTLQSGFLMILPNDSAGNFVLAYNPSKIKKCTGASQRRVFFYMMHHLMEQASFQGTGRFKILVIISKEEANAKKKPSFSDIVRVFPVTLESCHLILDTEGLVDGPYKESAAMCVFDTFDCAPDQLVIHTCVPGIRIAEELSVYGFRPHQLPADIGGTWTDESFIMWQEDVVEFEKEFRTQDQPQIRVGLALASQPNYDTAKSPDLNFGLPRLSHKQQRLEASTHQNHLLASGNLQMRVVDTNIRASGFTGANLGMNYASLVNGYAWLRNARGLPLHSLEADFATDTSNAARGQVEGIYTPADNKDVFKHF